MFFDSHAHLNFNSFQNDGQKIINSCLQEKIWLVNVGSQFSTSQKAVEIAEQYQEGVWAAVGLHPADAEKENFEEEKYLDLAKNSSKVVAVGETGLDYFRLPNDETKKQKAKNSQKELLLKHLTLAQKLDKPLIIHCREAHSDLIEILKSKPEANGVIHCFSGNSQEAKQYLQMGFYLGFTGIITFTNAYNEIICQTPLERILIETDCPYLAPVPHRGQRNEPSFVQYTAQKIAEIRGLPLEKIAKQTSQNARQLFRV